MYVKRSLLCQIGTFRMKDVIILYGCWICAYMLSMMQKSLVIPAYVMFVFKRMLCHSSIICVRHHFMLDGIESLLYSCIQLYAFSWFKNKTQCF